MKKTTPLNNKVIKQTEAPPKKVHWFFKTLLIILSVLIIISLLAMVRFWWLNHNKKEVLGVSFSQEQAERFGGDWHQNYTALLDELGFRHIRVPAYWNRIEPQPGRYNFSETDYMVAEAKKRGAKLTMVIGQKNLRVPECYYPSWLDKNNSEQVQTEVNKMLKATVEHYKNEPTIEAWQLENEFLLKDFGVCPSQNLTNKALKAELATVQNTDNTRPIIITQSNQTGFPIFGPLANVYGFSMYRWVWSPFGYYRYPQTGIYNWWKAAIINLYTGQDIKVHELQTEAWDKVGNENLDFTRSQQTMNPRQLAENIDYARQTQIKRIDLWGSEWWYALKQQGHPEMWEAVANLPNKD
ncbi:beta-galactosidase [Candidatus Saccharibacteria bacterium]|nr:beta-galactosidase [Candidatus Saccharibacteria bacterium]